ncbi:MAG: VOC family protein [Candidatus Microsaccharimonas sp.]
MLTALSSFSGLSVDNLEKAREFYVGTLDLKVVEDIDATVDHLGAGHHGLTFERYDNMPGEQDEKGILRGKAANQGPDIAWFKDPAGNILAVLQP